MMATLGLAPFDPTVVVDHPSGFLALAPRNTRFTADGVPGFVAFRERGRHLIAFGGVHAPREAQATLLDRFLAHAERRDRRVIAVQVRQSQVPLFADRGFTVNQLGSSFAVTLSRFSLAGAPRMQLRNKIARARRAGLRVVEVGRDVPSDERTFQDLEAVSAAWLAAKRRKELEFMIGELGRPGDPHRRIFVALDRDDRALGFITYVPAWGERRGYLHDLTRRRPDAPPGTMELVNATAIARMIADDVGHLHFGFTPFIVDGPEPPGASRLAAAAVRLLRRHGAAVYPAETQAAYKLKWGPDVIEPEYLAACPLSLRAIVDLLLLTRSI